jgi:hypothetical protein
MSTIAATLLFVGAALIAAVWLFKVAAVALLGGLYRVGRTFLLLFAMAVVLALGGLCSLAWAQEHDRHSELHDFYKHWKQPGGAKNWNGGPASCCNAREVDWDDASGWPRRVMGDCYATEFRLKPGGSWVAKLDRLDRQRLDKEWVDVPDIKIIRERNPDFTGRDGHLCTGTAGEILCAVPPTGAF